ncbi:MAG: YeeE/YedE family protein [Anaerolineae bacterium]|nr:YeeE/YedE family protein [Anaerolineae bacterium]
MSVGDILLALALGFVFGWVLDKGGLNRYYKIANVFRFTDLTVLRFMMMGMAVGMVGIYTLKYFGLADLTAVSATVLAGNLIGGAIFGVGMSLSGF